ncbi:MAG: orotidine-5'-phosphate decarboxylase [Acidobacteria bacterium]|nr:orotidine-5'-phosphate decarboxylase [Acidobacteriota bacterium]
MPPRREDSGRRHGRHRVGGRCDRVHDSRRVRRAGGHGQLRRSVHLDLARRRHSRLPAAPRHRAGTRPDGHARHDRARKRVDQLLVALDVETGARALQLADLLRDLAGGFKVGSRLFTLEGPDLVRRLVDRGARVFLDLKFHDIPNTVAQAVEAAVQTGAWMVDVHASGGVPMMQAAARAGQEAAARVGRPAPLVVGITVLTSMDEAVLRETGVARPLVDQVVSLARMAHAAGLQGVVASPHETAAIRQACGSGFTIVTPGIRGAAAGGDRHDQTRTMGPAEAVRAGANFIVVGRPILAAPDPRAAAHAIADALAQAAGGPHE